MQPRHRVSQGGIELIKRFEGYRARAARLPDGRHVIGYGHVRSARAGAEVSPADAEALLRYDLQAVEASLDELVFTPLNRNQTDALAAFAFSVGHESFRRSNVLRRVNEGDLLGAAAALESWRRAEFEGEPIVVDALIRRRAAEKLLFLTPTEGFIAAPSSVLKPELDYGALPLRTPLHAAELVTPLDGDEASAERLDGGEPPAYPPAPSPALAAAERVSQRLQALFAEDTDPDPARTDDRPPELSSDPATALASPAATVHTPEPLPSHPVPDDDGDYAPVADPDQAFDRRIAHSEPAEEAAPAVQKESGWPYLALGALALALFAISIAIILRAQEMGETRLFERNSLMGTTLAIIAIVGLCTAVYHGLRTWGERADRNDGK
jgi:lysozyme